MLLSSLRSSTVSSSKCSFLATAPQSVAATPVFQSKRSLVACAICMSASTGGVAGAGAGAASGDRIQRRIRRGCARRVPAQPCGPWRTSHSEARLVLPGCFCGERKLPLMHELPVMQRAAVWPLHLRAWGRRSVVVLLMAGPGGVVVVAGCTDGAGAWRGAHAAVRRSHAEPTLMLTTSTGCSGRSRLNAL